MYSTSFDEIFDKMIGNEDEVIIKRDNQSDDLVLLTAKKYNAILEELKRFQYWNEIDKRMEDLHAGKGQIHELIEVDDD